VKTSRHARLAWRAMREAFMVSVREKVRADSSFAPDEFKLFEKRCKPKWFLRQESWLAGALAI
jgi:hypothetical protein